MAVIATSYYWLDDGPEIYQPIWLLGSLIWYTVIILSIACIRNKTRLGYLMACILSWITPVFWLFDNYYVVFQTSILSSQPNDLMIIRNFIVIFTASLTVIASHNLFHKVIDYQSKGKPI